MIGTIRIVGWLIPLSLAQAAIVAGGVWVALLTLPPERARLRHGLTVAALALMAVSFVFTAGMLLVDWNAHVSCWARAEDPGRAVPMECRSHGVPVPAHGSVNKTPAVMGWQSMVRVPVLPAGRTGARAWTRVSGVFGAAWLAVFLLLGLRELRIRRAVSRARREASPIHDQRVGSILGHLLGDMGIERPVEVRESRVVTTPCVTGVRAPVVLLPFGLSSALEPGELRDVLAHELAHVVRRDVATVALQRAATSLLFFNPFAAWISRQAREEREAACDRIAVENGRRSPTEYARILLLLEGYRTSPLGVASAPGLLGEGQLARRVRRVLDRPRTEHPVHRFSIAFVAMTCLLTAALAQTTLAGASLGSWAIMAEDDSHDLRSGTRVKPTRKEHFYP